MAGPIMTEQVQNARDDSADFETTVSDQDRLDLRVWLRLLTCSNLIEGQVRRQLRESFETTLPRFDILAQLDRAPGGLTMGELSRRTMVTNGNVTGLVNRLESEKLVARATDADDHRVQHVRLTAAGSRAFSAMADTHRGWIEAMTAGMNGKSLGQLYGLLGALKESLLAYPAGTAKGGRG